AEWPTYAGFFLRNGDWPGLELMRRQAERRMPGGLPASELRAFFGETGPLTGAGALRYAQALTGEEAEEVRVRAWAELPMRPASRKTFLDRFGTELQAHHADRMDTLLWDGELEAAEELLPMVSEEERALAKARIALQRRADGVDALIAAVPESLANHPGLAHDRFDWRMRKDRYDSSETLLLERSATAALLGRPDRWASRRRLLARRAMRQDRFQTAYRLASAHHLSEGSNFSDLEWLSGYLALEHLDRSAKAIEHFKTFRAAVTTPISLGRAGYWLGRAYEATGNAAAAREAYAEAARYQTSFYGQLAAERISAAPDPSLAGGEVPDWRQRGLASIGPVRAALALQAAGDEALARRFLLHAQETMGPMDGAALAGLALEMGQTPAAVRIAKRVARQGMVYPTIYYPVVSLGPDAADVPQELALAIARQESELNAVARSPAGALGLMQLMPATAQLVARQLELPYSRARLTADPNYNVALGTQYLSDMLARYDGSVILAAAAYNAGPHRVDAWLREYGDPRRAGTDPVGWIESIPFRETRNYVMRVAESVHVYRTRIAGKAGAIGLSQMIGLTPS
ncbi:MAG: lytic transglycosylase domain-containing protein, partial [Pseudomonadota bacterium]